MNQQAMSSVSPERTAPVLGSNTSTPRISTVTLPSALVSLTSGSPKTVNRLPAPVFFSSSSPMASAVSRVMLCKSLQRFAAVVGTDPVDDFGRRQRPVWLDDGSLAVHPL